MTATEHRWSFWIDRGGTFTDVVARRLDGEIRTEKLLSEAPDHYIDATVEGIRRVLRIPSDTPLPMASIESLRIGTTLATNTLLERTGEPVALVVTRGFGDLLRIGYQDRPELFARHIVLPEPLCTETVEIEERMGADGGVVTPLDTKQATALLEAVRRRGVTNLVICLLHGYRYPEHEHRLAELARMLGFRHVQTSHKVSPLARYVSRAETCTVDAYLTPIMRRYVQRIRQELGEARVFYMQSNGRLRDATTICGKDSILSGPAGGLIGAVEFCHQLGYDRVISFDMGGTSTDVAHYAGEYERDFENHIAGVRLRTPMLRIHTVAAGGGSILRYAGGRCQVGPQSAGAMPGPACYRRGGPPTLTDCNVVLGRVRAAYFPAVFGTSGKQPLDRHAALVTIGRLARELAAADGTTSNVYAVAEGFVEIAVQNMANAIRKVSIRHGRDPSEYVLCCFGGAGGQHACRVAEQLGISKVAIHPLAGLMSAWGMGQARYGETRWQALDLELEASTSARIEAVFRELEEKARRALERQGLTVTGTVTTHRARLHYQGSDTLLELDVGDITTLSKRFERLHRERFGFAHDLPVLVAEAYVEITGGEPPCKTGALPEPGKQESSTRYVRVYLDGHFRRVPLYGREQLVPGIRIDGPALITETNSTNVIEPGWYGKVDAYGNLLFIQTLDRQAAVRTQVSTARLEIFNNLFMSVAEQMGITLRDTAHSVNIKERLDFSCAVFDAEGNLVANAPHVPVHLGSMGETVRAVLTKMPLANGETCLINDPYNGGTHLPDITAVTPVYIDGQREFLVASRGHHADVGGSVPGSMPAYSHVLEEEGVLLEGFTAVKAGRLEEHALRTLLTRPPMPVRNVEQNITDIKAQLAANKTGADLLCAMVDKYSIETVRDFLCQVQDNATRAVKNALVKLGRGGHRVYAMDGGERIEVRVALSLDGGAVIDFTGTSRQSPGNLNAPPAVVRAAVLYVLRCLVDEDIPLNDGCLRPIRIIVPPGSLLGPVSPAAVAAGNVETSQAIVNALFGALGVLAAGQGTMNNLCFGNARYQYYETLGGGAGAGLGFLGASAVHTHMTNSRLTDTEILEQRFPVRVERLAVRAGSGGNGLYRGGDGMVRELGFMEAMQLSILSGHRRVAPFGLLGGQDGTPGRNTLVYSSGRRETLDGTAQVTMAPGDRLIIETPGGGGYGEPP